MIALQASIGALNDLIDAPATPAASPASRSRPASCRVRGRPGVLVVGGRASGSSWRPRRGPATVVSPSRSSPIGYGYDLFAKGTAWSWLPFAVGIPLLPVFGWFGATGAPARRRSRSCVPRRAGRLGPGDRQRQRRPRARRAGGTARSRSASGWSGPGRSRRSCSAVVVGAGARSRWPRRRLDRSASLGLASAIVVVGAGLALGRRATPRRRERAWEIQAVGIGAPAAVWLAAVSAPEAGARSRLSSWRRRSGRARSRSRAELRDRQVLREVRPVRLRDRPADLRAAQDVDELLDGVGQVLLGVDERVIRDRDAPATRRRRRAVLGARRLRRRSALGSTAPSAGRRSARPRRAVAGPRSCRAA